MSGQKDNQMSKLPEISDPPPPYAMTSIDAVPNEDGYWTESHGHVKLHPLIAAAHQNRTQNQLCSLPDSVLLRIMRLSDPVTLECLRRCSRIFLRLFSDACTSTSDFSTQWLWRFPWPVSKLKLEPWQQREFLSLLERDWYCQACLSARRRSDWQERLDAMTKIFLHCSACEIDHPAGLFSAAQRHSSPSSRICIGHEGHLRLCEHETISWPQVLRKAKSLSDKRGQLYAMKSCAKSSHLFRCERRTTSTRHLFGLVARPSSTPIHDCCPPRPTVCVGYPGGKRTRYFEIQLSWSAHLPRAMTGGGSFGPEELARGIAMLREHGAQYICPQLEPGQVSGSRLFDPNRCGCLDYGGRKITAWDRPPRRHQPLPGSACRHDPTQRFGQIGDEETDDAHNGHGHTAFKSSREKCSVDMIWLASKYRSANGFKTEVIRCPGGSDCVEVVHSSRVSFHLDREGALPKMSRSWYLSLDPDSYRLVQDQEAFGLFWCMSEGCRNHYRHTRSRLLSLLSDYRHECPHKLGTEFGTKSAAGN